MAYLGLCIPETYQEANFDFEDVGVTLKEIQRKTDYYFQTLPDSSEELAVIRSIKFRLV